MAATADEAAGRVFNVGNDIDHSLAEIAEIVVDATGSTGQVRCREWPADHQRIDIGSFRSDSAAIATAIGWRPATELDDGMRRTVTFYRDRPWYLS